MITRLQIHGFKSIFNVSLELGAVNVFVGANGSGKSNLLEAVGVMSAAIHGTIEPETLKHRGVRLGVHNAYRSSSKTNNFGGMFFAAESDKAGYHIGFDALPLLPQTLRWEIKSESLTQGRPLLVRTDGLCHLSGTGSSIEPYQCSIPKDESAAWLGVRFQGEEHTVNARLLLKSLVEYAIYTPTTIELRNTADEHLRSPLGLGGSGLHQAVDQLIDLKDRKFGPFDLDEVLELIEWADDISFSSMPWSSPSLLSVADSGTLSFVDKYMQEDRGPIMAHEASEGALYVLFLLALVGHEHGPKLFAVDNFDQALHPRLACALTRLVVDQILDDGSRQMLATTHNPLVLDGLDLLDDRVRLFAVDRDSTGATQVNRILVTEELMAQADKGMSLSRLWVQGRLGGVPKNL